MPPQINANRQKFCQTEASAATADAVASASDNSCGSGNTNDAAGTRKITARGRTDFGQLLQKFSRSDSSNSEERSDGEVGKTSTSGVTRHRSFVRRQGAEEKASSSGSEAADRLPRRTPERAQSLRVAEKSAIFSTSAAKTSELASKPGDSASSVPSVVPTAASTKGNVEVSSGLPRRARSTRETSSGNNSEDGGNSSSSSSSRSGFRSEFMAKRLAGQKNSSASVNTTSSPAMKSSSLEENAPASSSKDLSDSRDSINGSLTFISGRTGDPENKDVSSKDSKREERVQGGVLKLGGVTTTASTDSSVSLGILPAVGESSTDNGPSPVVSEEKKSPRSAFLTRLNQSPEKVPAQKDYEVGSLLQSLRSQRKSSRSSSVETAGVQGSAALLQLSARAKEQSPTNGSSQPGDEVPAPSEPNPSIATHAAAPRTSQEKTNGISGAAEQSHSSKPAVSSGSGRKPLEADFKQSGKSMGVYQQVTTTSVALQQPVDTSSTERMTSAPEMKSRANTFAAGTTTSVSDSSRTTQGETSMRPLSNSSMKRSASLREVPRKDSFETKRKGILKRTSSLSKSESDNLSTFPVVDPQLAKILQQRKKLMGDMEEKVEEEDDEEEEENAANRRRRSRALSAAEEIEETIK